MLDGIFKLTENGTTARTEVLAGLTTFLTMAYIVFVNPSILGDAGMPKDAVFVATCLIAALGTGIMALYANYPIALAPGMGLNAYFAYAVVLGMGFKWQVALGAVFISGCLFLAITIFRLRELIVRATELPLQYDENGPAGHVVALLLDELHGSQALKLHLPMPRSKRLAMLCRALLDAPGDRRTLGEWAHTVHASERTMARLFQRETGLSFAAWRQQARVLEAMGRLGSGAPVTQVALDLGYDSVSAFSAMFRRAAGTSPSAYRQRVPIV